MEKKKINEEIVCWDTYEFQGKLKDIIDKLQNEIDSHPYHFDFTLEVDKLYGYYREEETNISIRANRWETDEELEKRTQIAKKDTDRRKKFNQEKEERKAKEERETYERLKKKFEEELDNGQKT